MITRLWRGWTATENADPYERFLLDDLFPSMRDIRGFRGADVLRRPEGNEVAFVILTRFDSLDAIRAFAGDNYEVPVLDRGRTLFYLATSSGRPTSIPLRLRLEAVAWGGSRTDGRPPRCPTDRRQLYAFGSMFWLTRKKLSWSYVDLICARRS
ncbi:MAG: hypothetical protein M3O25_05460 [Actinomycetota bacterium]|nr:hypothetical protein [Actinomycetota bacterium]